MLLYKCQPSDSLVIPTGAEEGEGGAGVEGDMKWFSLEVMLEAIERAKNETDESFEKVSQHVFVC